VPYALNDSVTLNLTALASATVVLNVTAPDGTESTPATSNVLTTWSATVTANQVGRWQYAWVVTGTASNVEIGYFDVDLTAYATVAALKVRLGVTSSSHDSALLDSLLEVSREITQYCGRSFNADSTATARLFYPTAWDRTEVDDFYTTTGLIVAEDTGNDGTYETTWASTDYQPEPLNGVVDGEPGWPFWHLRAVASRMFPCVDSTTRAPLQVTAKWGWTTVPSPVRDACLILAEESFKLPDSPFGVGGYGPYGIVRVRENPVAARKLNPYRKHPVLVG
jgi:hypothetical protein